MEKKKKIIIGVVVGVVIIGVIAYYMKSKKKKNQENKSADADLDLDIPEVIIDDSGKMTTVDMSSDNTDGRDTFPMGYLSDSGGSIHAVHLNKRPKDGTIKVGQKVRITNTSFDGTYPVTKIWIDKSGNVGAVYLEIPYKPSGKSDTTFANKGVIEVIR